MRSSSMVFKVQFSKHVADLRMTRIIKGILCKGNGPKPFQLSMMDLSKDIFLDVCRIAPGETINTEKRQFSRRLKDLFCFGLQFKGDCTKTDPLRKGWPICYNPFSMCFKAVFRNKKCELV